MLSGKRYGGDLSLNGDLALTGEVLFAGDISLTGDMSLRGDAGYGTGVSTPLGAVLARQPNRERSKRTGTSSKPTKRRFILVSSQGYRLGPEYMRSHPYKAARKAIGSGDASGILYLADPRKNKVHVYEGVLAPGGQQTAYARARGLPDTKVYMRHLGSYNTRIQ